MYEKKYSPERLNIFESCIYFKLRLNIVTMFSLPERRIFNPGISKLRKVLITPKEELVDNF